MDTTRSTQANTFARITTLLSTNLKSILKKEVHNDNRVNLYGAGEYWVAFEKSAYMLDKMTDKSDKPMVLHLQTHPFPIVMRSIHSLTVNDMCRHHIVAKKQLEYLQLMTQPTDDASYNEWYREFVINKTLM